MLPQKSFSFFNTGNNYRVVWLLLAAIIILRIVFTGIMGLMPQDAYYYMYSENLALSYFDHPPIIAYMLRFFTILFGHTVFAIKIANFVVTGFTIFSFYYLCKLFINKDRLNKAVLLFISTFMVTIISLISTPDVPLMLFWTLSLIAIYNAVFLGKKWNWLLAGLLMGLAFDSKYTGIFLPFGLTLFLILSASYRRYLFSFWFWLAILIFILTISPVIIWNIEHQLASFQFQTTDRFNSVHGLNINLTYFFGVIGHQSFILIPILFLGLLFLLIKAIKKNALKIKAIQPASLFTLCFFLPLFFLFLSLSFIFWVKLNWIMPAYITGIIWVSRYFTHKWVRIQVIASFIIHVVLAFEIFFYAFPIQSDDTWYGWKDLSNQVKQVESKYPEAFVFSADGNKTSAVLDFYLDEKIYYPNIIGEKALQMDFISGDLTSLAGKEAILIDSSPSFKDDKKAGTYPPKLNTYFSSVKEIDPILIKRRGQTVRKFFVYICKNYLPVKK